ncbi:MAG: hypothetical protein ACRDPK_00530 [Carbonactinosporaceae bacterium]
MADPTDTPLAPRRRDASSQAELDASRSTTAGHDADTNADAELLDRLASHVRAMRISLALTRHHYADLLTAARATLIAAEEGDPDPLFALRDELTATGHLPTTPGVVA